MMTSPTCSCANADDGALSQDDDDAAAAQRFADIYVELQPTLLGIVRRGLTLAGGSEAPTPTQGVVYGVGGVSPEDLAQDTWAKVWRQWPLLHTLPAQVIYAYALQTARRLVIDHQRHRAMRARRGERALTPEAWDVAVRSTPTEALDEQPEAALLADEGHRAVWQVARATLARHSHAPALDTVLLAALAEREPLAVTAERLGVTIGIVKMRQSRLRTLLRVPALLHRRRHTQRHTQRPAARQRVREVTETTGTTRGTTTRLTSGKAATYQ